MVGGWRWVRRGIYSHSFSCYSSIVAMVVLKISYIPPPINGLRLNMMGMGTGRWDNNHNNHNCNNHSLNNHNNHNDHNNHNNHNSQPISFAPPPSPTTSLTPSPFPIPQSHSNHRRHDYTHFQTNFHATSN